MPKYLMACLTFWVKLLLLGQTQNNGKETFFTRRFFAGKNISTLLVVSKISFFNIYLMAGINKPHLKKKY